MIFLYIKGGVKDAFISFLGLTEFFVNWDQQILLNLLIELTTYDVMLRNIYLWFTFLRVQWLAY